MTVATGLRRLAFAAVLLFAVAPAAYGQVEVGTSLASLVVTTGETKTTAFGVPVGGFGLVNPAVYASIFVTPHFSLEPQVGLMVISHGGDTSSIANVAGQGNYFFYRSDMSSPYVFGSVGVVAVSGGGSTLASFGAGGGYRMLAAGRVTIRIDGRVTHFNNGGGNIVAFAVSLGGVFGKTR